MTVSNVVGFSICLFCHSQGYQQKNGFIVTQIPMSNTTSDYWRMIMEQECKYIVYFNDNQVCYKINTSCIKNVINDLTLITYLCSI